MATSAECRALAMECPGQTVPVRSILEILQNQGMRELGRAVLVSQVANGHILRCEIHWRRFQGFAALLRNFSGKSCNLSLSHGCQVHILHIGCMTGLAPVIRKYLIRNLFMTPRTVRPALIGVMTADAAPLTFRIVHDGFESHMIAVFMPFIGMAIGTLA